MNVLKVITLVEVPAMQFLFYVPHIIKTMDNAQAALMATFSKTDNAFTQLFLMQDAQDMKVPIVVNAKQDTISKTICVALFTLCV